MDVLMKMKNTALILSAILVMLGLLHFLGVEPEIESSQGAQILTEPVKNTVANSITKPLEVKVIAKTNKEAEILASELYNELFSIVGLKDGLISDVEAGESISVHNFFDANELPSQFIPLYANNKVVGVSIFREYVKGEKKPGRMSEILEDWYSYPPVMPYDAETELSANYSTLHYTSIDGYFFIEDRKTPYYLYEGGDGESSKYYLVNAYNKSIVIKKSRDIQKSVEEENLPIKFSEDGLVELDDVAMANSNLTDEKLQELKLEIVWINQHIKEGTIKLDKNMHIIYDSRKKDDNIFSSGETTQYSARNSYDDKKMDNSIEEVPVIE